MYSQAFQKFRSSTQLMGHKRTQSCSSPAERRKCCTPHVIYATDESNAVVPSPTGRATLISHACASEVAVSLSGGSSKDGTPIIACTPDRSKFQRVRDHFDVFLSQPNLPIPVEHLKHSRNRRLHTRECWQLLIRGMQLATRGQSSSRR